jgi:hypothetical protein
MPHAFRMGAIAVRIEPDIKKIDRAAPGRAADKAVHYHRTKFHRGRPETIGVIRAIAQGNGNVDGLRQIGCVCSMP